MAVTTVTAGMAAAFMLTIAPTFAQTPTLTPGCTATPAQLEANKKVAMEFFRPGVDRVALADPTYKQHNPAFVKGGREANLSDVPVLQVTFRWTTSRWRSGCRRRSRSWCCRCSAAAAGQSTRDRHGGVRSRDDHSQELPSGSDRGSRHVLRSLHVRHIPRAQQQAGRTLGWCCDQSAGDWRTSGTRQLTKIQLHELLAPLTGARSHRSRRPMRRIKTIWHVLCDATGFGDSVIPL